MRGNFYSVAGPLGVFALWEIVVRTFGIPVYVLPAPSAIGMKVFADSALMIDGLAMTLMEAVVGYAVGSALALTLAIGFILWPRLERVGLPALVALNSVPVVAFAPVALRLVATAGEVSSIMEAMARRATAKTSARASGAS